MKDIFSSKMKKFRTDMGLSQELLAQELGVSPQAISKWECSQSYPDIELLPEIAKLFNITIDELFSKETRSVKTVDSINLPKDGVLRIVQVKDGSILSSDEYSEELKIKVDLQEFKNISDINIEIRGNASIYGDINGNVSTGQEISCKNISGNADAGQGITCKGGISGSADAGQGITCGGGIAGNVSAGQEITCGGGITGNVDAGQGITCGGDISGSVNAGTSIECKNIESQDVAAGQIIKCESITGETINISCRKELDCKVINGNVVFKKLED